MESEFVTCECGRQQLKRKMRARCGVLMCGDCAKVAEARQKRQERNADQYQAVVSLLDGTNLYFCKLKG